MRSAFRWVLAGFALLFLAAFLVQVYFAGLMLFGQPEGRDLHLALGYSLGTAAALFLALPALARAGRRTVVLGVALFFAAFFQPNIALLRADAPVIAALHPVNALLIFTLSVVMARRALGLVREARIPLDDGDAASADEMV